MCGSTAPLANSTSTTGPIICATFPVTCDIINCF
ncbi:MAG: hypothetical protein ACI825_001824 [Planctomycetota bacterium]